MLLPQKDHFLLKYPTLFQATLLEAYDLAILLFFLCFLLPFQPTLFLFSAHHKPQLLKFYLLKKLLLVLLFLYFIGTNQKILLLMNLISLIELVV